MGNCYFYLKGRPRERESYSERKRAPVCHVQVYFPYAPTSQLGQPTAGANSQVPDMSGITAAFLGFTAGRWRSRGETQTSTRVQHVAGGHTTGLLFGMMKKLPE